MLRPGIHSEFQDSLYYMETHCLKKQRIKQTNQKGKMHKSKQKQKLLLSVSV